MDVTLASGNSKVVPFAVMYAVRVTSVDGYVATTRTSWEIDLPHHGFATRSLGLRRRA